MAHPGPRRGAVSSFGPLRTALLRGGPFDGRRVTVESDLARLVVHASGVPGGGATYLSTGEMTGDGMMVLEFIEEPPPPPPAQLTAADL